MILLSLGLIGIAICLFLYAWYLSQLPIIDNAAEYCVLTGIGFGGPGLILFIGTVAYRLS